MAKVKKFVATGEIVLTGADGQPILDAPAVVYTIAYHPKAPEIRGQELRVQALSSIATVLVRMDSSRPGLQPPIKDVAELLYATGDQTIADVSEDDEFQFSDLKTEDDEVEEEEDDSDALEEALEIMSENDHATPMVMIHNHSSPVAVGIACLIGGLSLGGLIGALVTMLLT